MICAAGARGRRHWCAATRARSRHDRGGVRGRLTRCRRSRRRSAARTDSRPTAVDKRVLSSTARDTVITFVVLEHHVVACTSPPSGRTSNGRSLRCRRTVDVNQYTVRASPRGFGALGGQRRAALVGCVSGLDRRCSGGLRTCFSALFVHYSSHHWGLADEDPRFTRARDAAPRSQHSASAHVSPRSCCTCTMATIISRRRVIWDARSWIKNAAAAHYYGSGWTCGLDQ